MKLKVRCIDLDAGGKTIAIINSEDAIEFGVHPLERLILRKGRKTLTVIVDITKRFAKPGEIIAYKEVTDILGLKNGDIINAERREELLSKKYIRKKINGSELNYNEMLAIVKDVLERNLNDLELAAFITALQIRHLTMSENAALTKAMIDTSKKIKFSGTVVDKHSIGGISGDKTTLLLVPIIASTGLIIPKTSSRAITSPAGTADRMETFAPVDLGIEEIKKVVKKCRGCIVWGGSLELSPADDMFIQVEKPLSFDPMLMPSVVSKKKVVGSKFVIIDIPCGSGGKMKTKEDGETLARSFIALGKKFGMKINCAMTCGDQPIGRAIGPALEAREALETIMNRGQYAKGINRSAPDLVDKATTVAGLLLEMCGKGDKKTAEKILYSGKAEKKLREIIAAQGGNPDIKPEDIPFADYKISIKSGFSGIVSGVNDDTIAYLARVAGAPKDKLAGIMLNKKICDRVEKGETLFTIYAERKPKLNEAVKISKTLDIFSVFNRKKKMLIEEI
ncbi:MAG: AMP phosphorylase [Candidatus Aenigmatarchaeota archaeon]